MISLYFETKQRDATIIIMILSPRSPDFNPIEKCWNVVQQGISLPKIQKKNCGGSEGECSEIVEIVQKSVKKFCLN
jgi:hypothetical protein